ncbi:MAG: helix-turn-helix transcriptional regulator [Clostridia bacterium]|nr:helix-turn-helix transcriptional regulator [Clostridia bacterium]
MFSMQPVRKTIDIKGFNSIYYFEFGKNFTHAPEKHPFWEMVYVDSGKILAITDGDSKPLNQGQIIFHEPNEVHAHVSDFETPNNMLVVSFTCDSEAMNFFNKKTFTADKTTRTLLQLFLNEAKNSLESIPNDFKNKTDLDFSGAKFGSIQLLSCYLEELLINIIRNNTDSEEEIPSGKLRGMLQSEIFEKVIEYMKNNIYNTLTLTDICEHFMLGKSQLSFIIKSNSGKSVMEYYNDLKISEAKLLLRSDKYSVSQISDMLGYSCIHSFSRAFKRAVGSSPVTYKKRII